MQRLPSIAPSSSHRRRHACAIVPALLGLLLLLRPAVALAQSHAGEAAATALQKKAMEDDYLNTDFDKAAEKLGQAIAKCGTDKCGIPLRGKLKRDLAVVQSAMGHKDQALAAMTDALKIDAGIKLDPNFKTKEMDAIFAEAKKAAAGGGPAAPPPTGDFTHTPVTEQQVRTPVPIYVEYSGSETLKRVLVKYKGLGMTEWKSLDLKAIGKGFGATTPCADSQAGDFTYYVQGFNEQNDPVASGGDRQAPYRVTIKNEAVNDPPHLPGQQPPQQCPDTGDCPPDFPGCKKPVATEDSSLKGAGESCEDDSECKSGTCKDEKCTKPKEEPSSSSSSSNRKKFWVGVAGSLDFTLMSSASNVCQLYLLNQSLTYGTTIPVSPTLQGRQRTARGTTAPLNGAGLPRAHDRPASSWRRTSPPTRPTASAAERSRATSGSLASFDYALTPEHDGRARLGYVARTYPGTQAAHFAPFHGEARYTYVFGDEPIGKAGLHPFVLAGAGVLRVRRQRQRRGPVRHARRDDLQRAAGEGGVRGDGVGLAYGRPLVPRAGRRRALGVRAGRRGDARPQARRRHRRQRRLHVRADPRAGRSVRVLRPGPLVRTAERAG